MHSNLFRGTLVCSLLVILLLAAGCTQPSGPTQIPVTPSVAPSLTAEPFPQGSSKEAMVAFVKEASAYAKANGREKALAEFSDPKGSFFRGDLYIYAYDYSGLTIAHPVNPEKIGVNRLEERDADGKLFIRELMDASTDGTGFVEYTYINPTQNNRVEKKLGYVEQVDEDWWLGSGIYYRPVDQSVPDPDATPDE
ncbi:MAG: histidine kinase [Methanomicrobiales archaeon HGW-Methanomicrobiales-3]|jgi:signal transduction histidine kinase|nr:MAG: histidine kinase [Methanomicrobiales archaeon HGW-Methanomicrobiales-3]